MNFFYLFFDNKLMKILDQMNLNNKYATFMQNYIKCNGDA
jgi:hypothetical protein